MKPIVTALTKNGQEYTGIYISNTPQAHILDEFGALVETLTLSPIYDEFIGEWFQDAFIQVEYEYSGYALVESNLRVETETDERVIF